MSLVFTFVLTMLKLISSATVAYQAQTGMPINGGGPMIAYVAMGINPMNEPVLRRWMKGMLLLIYACASV